MTGRVTVHWSNTSYLNMWWLYCVTAREFRRTDLVTQTFPAKGLCCINTFVIVFLKADSIDVKQRIPIFWLMTQFYTFTYLSYRHVQVQYNEILCSWITACLEAGVTVKIQPLFDPVGVNRVKVLVEKASSGWMAELGVKCWCSRAEVKHDWQEIRLML